MGKLPLCAARASITLTVRINERSAWRKLLPDSLKEGNMFRHLSENIRRGALVLLLVCIFSVFAFAGYFYVVDGILGKGIREVLTFFTK